MRLDGKIKRLGIFVFFDKDGIVDDYIIFLLKDLMENINKLTIICNGILTPEGREKLEQFSSDIYVRQNSGYDIAAWKYALTKHLSKEEISQYDELVLFNDTFYGPFEPFSNIFSKMNEKDIDFWGLTSHRESIDNAFDSEYGYRPCFIQSYFSVFRKKLISSNEFYDFWNSIREDYSYEEAVNCYENIFAQKFMNMGFKWETYINTDELFTKKENSICYNTYMPDYMLKIKRLPIIRRKVFVFPYDNYLEYSAGEGISESLEYIREHTDYDEGLIWQNLLRLYNIADLRNNLKLNYVLPSDVNKATDAIRKQRVAVIIHLYYTDIINLTAEYIRKIPSEIDVYITTNSESKAAYIREYFEKEGNTNITVMAVENRGRDVAALLVDCKDIIKEHDIFCFTHDKKTSANSSGFSVGNSYMHIVLENTIRNENYISNVLKLFADNPYMGMAGVPSPIHSFYFGSIGCEWTKNFEEAEKLAERLKLRLNICREKQPFILGTAFWARSKAIEPLLDYGFKHEDFHEEPLPADGTMSHALERIFPYIAQNQGFYSCWIMTDDYARIEVSNTRYLLSNIVTTQQKRMSVWELNYNRFIQLLQYEAALQSMPDVANDPLNKIGLCAKLYLKLNGEYDESNALRVKYYPESDGTFTIIFNVNTHKKCSELRFDPLDCRRCLVRIEKLLVDNNEVRKYNHNGIDLKGNYQLFEHIDPYYLFECGENVQQVVICGRISLLDDGATREIFDLKQNGLTRLVRKCLIKLRTICRRV